MKKVTIILSCLLLLSACQSNELENANLKEENEILNEKITALEANNSELKNENNDLKEKNRVLNISRDRLLSESDRLEKKIDSLFSEDAMNWTTWGFYSDYYGYYELDGQLYALPYAIDEYSMGKANHGRVINVVINHQQEKWALIKNHYTFAYIPIESIGDKVQAYLFNKNESLDVKGISIGSSIEEVTYVFGFDCTRANDAYGAVLNYGKGNESLSFGFNSMTEQVQTITVEKEDVMLNDKYYVGMAIEAFTNNFHDYDQYTKKESEPITFHNYMIDDMNLFIQESNGVISSIRIELIGYMPRKD